MGRKSLWKQYKSHLDRLHQRQVNFDLSRRHEYTEENGWYIDDYRVALPPEPPGPPIPGGSWELARQFMREYTFPDPTIVTGIYHPDHPLDERVMLLRARFLFLTFYFGVRVGEVIDETRQSKGGPLRVWGFNYRTLEGHFEKGQMDFQVIKMVETGRVHFRIHAFSRPAKIPNLFYRIGFLLFGRYLQRRFADRSLERMQQLVQARLSSGQAEPPARSPEVGPASRDEKAAQAMEQVQERARHERA